MSQTTPADLPRDLKELLKSFNDHDVRYLVLGAVAVGYHAQPRYTRDLDILIKPDAANAANAYRALASFGAPLAGVSIQELANETTFFRFGREPVAFDILSSVPGIKFDEAWERRVTGVIDLASGLQAHIVGRDDLIASKLASGRPQDLADVDAVRKAAKVKASGPPPSR
jgi:hypothetical protein